MGGPIWEFHLRLAYELHALGDCIKVARLKLLNADIILPINTSSCSVIELTYLYSLMGGGVAAGVGSKLDKA